MLPVHTILFPTDLSEESTKVFPLACGLAHDCGARVVVLYVMPPPFGPDVIEARHRPEEYYRGPKTALHRLQPPCGNINVEHRLAEGEAARVIVNTAAEVEAGLIFMSTHGRTGASRVLFGSVATEVLRHATCPVLTARLPLPPAETSGVRLEPADFATTGTDGGVMWPIKSILHPTDFSESSAKAFEAARALAADHHAKLIVLHVTSVPDLAYKGYGAPGAPLEEEEYIDKARRDLASLTSPSGIVLERLLEEGDAASQILRVANELKPDLVVMGTHGRSGLRHVLLGSVAEQIVRKATCPVLTVRAPAE